MSVSYFKAPIVSGFVVAQASSNRLRSTARTKTSNGFTISLPQNRAGLRILVVDSNIESTDCLCRHLGQWSTDVQVAHDGFSGLRTAAIQSPQVVIFQADLPWMSGFQMARHLRTDFPGCNVLILGIAKSADAKLRLLSVDSGVDALLAAPVNLADLDTLLLLECILKRGRHSVGSYNAK